MVTSLNDSEIIAGIRSKNNKVLSEFYRANLPNVRKFVVENSGDEDDANDVMQEGIILIYQKIQKESLHVNVSINAYLLATCKNIWLMRLRRKKKMIVNSDQIDILEGTEESLIFNLVQAEKNNLYRKHFLQLDQSCMDLLTQVFDGKSMKEIADSMGISLGYARKKKFICKERLMSSIQNDDIYHELKSHKSVI